MTLAAMARPSAAIRLPWRSATPCSTWCWSLAFSTVAAMGLRLKQRLAALKDEHHDIIEEVRGQGLMLGLKCKPPNQALLSRLLPSTC